MHDAYHSAAPASIWLITYEGQWDGTKMEGESPYTYQSPSLSAAMTMLVKLEEEYPTRKWTIEEKDVS